MDLIAVKGRFLELISHNTQSSEESQDSPSTAGQMEFAGHLAEECRKIGMSDVFISEFGYVYAALPSNVEKAAPKIGFIAHMDTSPDFSGENIRPRCVPSYDGGEIELSEGVALSPDEFPELRAYVGEEIIVTDGTTLLGADDKAGVAEILTAMEYLLKHDEILHGEIGVCFTPDEEIGRGADNFDVARFGCDFAYTVDGGAIGEIEFESFNAAKATFNITGRNIHPGYAKGIMVNAALIAAEIAAEFPKKETPAATEGREGYYHLCDMHGGVSEAALTYRIRSFEREDFERRKMFVLSLVFKYMEKYGENSIKIDIHDEYYNMREILEGKTHIVRIAEGAMENAGVKPVIRPIRGGTDGSRLSFMGLPCPNIFAGGHNFHGPFEFIPVGSMVKAAEVVIEIARLGASHDCGLF